MGTKVGTQRLSFVFSKGIISLIQVYALFKIVCF